MVLFPSLRPRLTGCRDQDDASPLGLLAFSCGWISGSLAALLELAHCLARLLDLGTASFHFVLSYTKV